MNLSKLNLNSDLDKNVDGEAEIISIDKTAETDSKELFTPLPPEVDVTLGVYPNDQDLSTKFVLLWDKQKLIPPAVTFNKDYKIYRFRIGNEAIRNDLINLGGGAYALPYLSNRLHFECVD